MTVSISKSQINIRDLHDDGRRNLNKEATSQEVTKRGTLRGGNSGCVLADGRIVGKCSRLSHLRSVGIDEEKDIDTYLMFAAGFLNEDAWLDCLKASWQGTIKCEEEIPVSWTTENGIVVTGRPDIVLCSSSGKPELGLELKLVSSPTTAYNVAAKGLPNLDHIIQAAHYMWQLDTPFKLVYTSRSVYGLGFPAMQKKWKEQPQFLNEEEGWKTKPFVVDYDLWFDNGTLCYSATHIGQEVQTGVTLDGIVSYYEKTSKMAESKDLGPRVTTLNADGTKPSWTKCGSCSFSEQCDNFEHDYELWLDNIRSEHE